MKTLIVIGVVALSIFCGLLSAWGGATGTSKAWRRWGIPVLLSAFGFAFVKWWALLLMILVIPYSIGHGIPSKNDEGSTLGQFWYNVWGDNLKMVDICVRLTVSALKCLSYIIIPIITGSWTGYALSACFLTGMNVLFGGDAIIRNEGEFKVFGKYLLWEEFILGFSDATAITLFIIIGG